MRLGTLTIPSPAVMGVLNVTPDSFSDGGQFCDCDAARHQAEKMAADGAAIIDIGGESTRPGAEDVSEQQELDRVMPVIEAVLAAVELPISIDTSKPRVMREAVAKGAAIVNDVYALQGEGAMAAAAELNVPVCLMHMQGRPRTMQQDPHYDDVAADVTTFLAERVAQCVAAGIAEDRIIVDPGFGFGKTHAHNVELLAKLRQLEVLGKPILVGMSRKTTLGELTGRDIDDRVAASVAAAVVAIMHGARIVRAHDVRETYDALQIAGAVLDSNL